MKSVRVPDVGHGLAARIITTSDGCVQIDCGSSAFSKYERELKRSVVSRGLNCFFLSHYHNDHYSGLTRIPNDAACIEKVRFPKIPGFNNRQQFIKALLATNLMDKSHQTGAWQTDLYQTICRINCTDFSFEPVSRGDAVDVGSSKFEVLWPPEKLPNNENKFSKAIKKFNKAVQEDELLKKVTEKIEEDEMIEPYLSSEEIHPSNSERDELPNDTDLAIEEREVPEVTKEARKGLKKAANMMSIVIHMDNRLLFMGDISKYIEQIVEKLDEKNRTHFQVMIPPHHGTHWDDAMEDLSTNWAVSSAGNRDSGNLKFEYKSISDNYLLTLFNGDVRLNSHMTLTESPYFPPPPY